MWSISVVVITFVCTASADAPTPAPAPRHERIPWQKDPPVENAYNLIYTHLNCRNNALDWTPQNICPNLEEGVQLPAYKERYLMLKANIYRMFPKDTGLKYKTSATNCGRENLSPYFLSQDAIEHARYFAKSSSECKDRNRQRHDTCSSDCQRLFGGGKDDCKYSGRLNAFKQNNGDGDIQELIIRYMNKQMKTDQCSQFFEPDRSFFGIGVHGDTSVMNVWTDDGTNKGKNKRWPLVMASHHNPVKGGFEAKVLYFNYRDEVVNAFVVYRGTLRPLAIKYGDKNRALFTRKPRWGIPGGCQPYYFFFVLSNNRTVRLPEDSRYMFATTNVGACTDDHYYDTSVDGTKPVFVADAGPNDAGKNDPNCYGCQRANNIDFSPTQLYNLATTYSRPNRNSK